MDFYQIKQRSVKKNGENVIEVYPDFQVCHSKDLMVRGKSFYAIWDEELGLWSTDDYDAQRIVDKEIDEYVSRMNVEVRVDVRHMSNFSSKVWRDFRTYLTNLSDNAHPLDSKLTFSNTKVTKSDYASKRLPYPLEEGNYDAFDEIIGTLYAPEERAKLEWSIGSVISGDSRDIQKFIVLYGEAGAGKSTILNIVQKLFQGYYTTFDAKALGQSSNAFATEVFKSNPLVAIQHDGDLSKIEDNTKLNSIISHEEIIINEKFKAAYSARIGCFLFMATNQPVKITDAKSGILRRLIDVRPSGNKIPSNRYSALMSRIDFELGAIAQHCLDVYRNMGKHYYDSYRPVDMMFKTNVFFNFVEDSYLVFKEQDSTTLKAAYSMYKTYCSESGSEYQMPMYRFREELKNYFSVFKDQAVVDGKHLRSYYAGFRTEKFEQEQPRTEEHAYSLCMECSESIFDEYFKDAPAQYASSSETPRKKWENVTTKLSDLDTSKLHYVKVPENHIVIDFDIKDENGEKSYEANLKAASKWPSTYAEVSKSGKGIHLHYIYDGDASRLSRIYDNDIEIKVFTGNSSLRRKVVRCNDIPIATINSGLPLKGEKVINFEGLRNEKALRTSIERNLRKEIHSATKPSVDFIYKILEDAYSSGMKYDVTDMRPRILAFANNSTNQAQYCIKLVGKMKFKSEDPIDNCGNYDKDDLIFFDVEVFPNLFVVVWKAEGKNPVKMINPTPTDIERLVRFKLVGFNCRRYDNHILYARLIGYDNLSLYKLSQKIVSGDRNAMFGDAYNISYTDVYDFSSKKQSLKKFEIELGIHHQELGLRWDEEVSEDLWVKVADYCVNDVVATEAVFNARKQDFVARQILSEISGLTVNDTNNQHTARIIFGNDANPKSEFVYTDLSEEFPGYSFKNGKSTYRGEEPGEGGYVYSIPGFYENVALLDIASMHPSTIKALNLFGDKYTNRFQELLDVRIFIKHKEYNKAKSMFDGKLAKYLTNDEDAKALSSALKIPINSVYGLTAASFDNKFRDPRNKDNIVAKRGALFMIDLKNEVESRGYTVAHIKTDSIKIPNADEEIINFVMEFGEKYGYTFEHEATYDKMCLVNDAVYIARYKNGEWTATGAQFQHPYVFKRLFSKEPIVFKDLCETKTVTTALYLDMNEDLPDVSEYEKELTDRRYNDSIDSGKGQKLRKLNISLKTMSNDELKKKITEGHDYHFVGKAGSFCPIMPGKGGGLIVREKDGKFSAATGSKGYRWLESEVVESLEKQGDIDIRYHIGLANEAIDSISKYCDFEYFTSDEFNKEKLPWEE